MRTFILYQAQAIVNFGLSPTAYFLEAADNSLGEVTGYIQLSGRATGWAPQLGSTISWAPRPPRITVQVPWLHDARCNAQQVGVAPGLAPCQSRAAGRARGYLGSLASLLVTWDWRLCLAAVGVFCRFSSWLAQAVG